MSDHLWNKDLERAVLGVALDGRHREAWGVLSQACPHPGFFFARDHQLVYLVMQALADRGVAIDAMAVIEECGTTLWRDAMERLQWLRQLEESGSAAPDRKLWRLPDPPPGVGYDDSVLVALGGNNAITDLAEVLAPATSLPRNCALVAEHYRQRRLLRLLGEAVATLSSAKGVRSVQDVGSSVINGASRELGQATGDVTMAEAIDSMLADGDAALAGGGAARASWGLPSLDAMAPLTAEMFAVLAAPPAGGKTSAMMQAVLATADLGGADSVAIVSREMGPPELARIAVSQRTGIPASSIRDGTLTRGERTLVEAELARWRESRAAAIQADADRVTVDDVCAWARLRQVRSAGRLRLLVVDYLQLLDSNNPRETEYQRISYATRKLKLLQRSLRVPILLLSQLSRDGTKAGRSSSGDLGNAPEPQLADLRGSGSIEQDANAIVFLWPREQPAATMRVSFKVAKNRAGGTGLIDCSFHRARGQVFKEVQAEAVSDRGARLSATPSETEDVFG
jgi:replicative DNA helicase